YTDSMHMATCGMTRLTQTKPMWNENCSTCKVCVDCDCTVFVCTVTAINIITMCGVLQVMLGSIPEKYAWFMSLLGMRGSVTVGQKHLAELKNSKSSLSQEATILLFTIKGFINQFFGEAAKGMLEYLKEQPDNRLALFITINMLMKDSQSETALELFQTLEKNNQGLPMYYADYLHGDALLQKGEYQKAITYYQKFQKGYRSLSFKKDSYYKIAICYWLLNDHVNSKISFEKAKTIGKESAEPDKYAAKQLEESQMPNQKLLKARFATDGGYYEQANAALQSIGATELKTIIQLALFLFSIPMPPYNQ
ncbi:MAG: tetratricopeptide repeat protein, partial [Flammeovirgaceae bacterium]